jgi:WD40 repeat protein
MQRLATALILTILTGLSVSACQAHQNIGTQSAVQTLALTSQAASSSSIEIKPTKTVLPPVSDQPVCFETYQDPIAFMSGNSRLLVKANTGVQIYNLEKLKEESFLKASTNLSDGPVVALSIDGETLAWALTDNTIQLVRVSDGKALHRLVGHTDPITKLRFSPLDNRLFSAAHDGWVRVWDSSGKLVNAFQPGGGEVFGIGLSADGKILATIPSDGPLKLWDAKNLQALAELGGSGGYDTSDVAFSADGRYIAADLAAGLSVWDVKDKTHLRDGINSMACAFSPQGNLLAYSDLGQDNNIILVSPDGKQKLA